MSSDAIKDALIDAYPGSSDRDWKRRTKMKEGSFTKREFEHPDHGRVFTYESVSGNITVGELVLADKVTATVGIKSLGTDSIFTGLRPMAIEKTRKATTPKAMPEIEAGDRIRIPANTTVFLLNHSDSAHSPKMLSRAINAGVTRIARPTNWLTYLDDAEVEPVRKVLKKILPRIGGSIEYLLGWITDERNGFNRFGGIGGIGNGNGFVCNTPEMQKALSDAHDIFEARFGPKARFIVWGKNQAAWIGAVEKVADAVTVKAARAERKPKEAKINKRRLMVLGSTWKVTKAVDIMLWIQNPKIRELIVQRDAIHRPSNTQIANIQSEISRVSSKEPSVLVNAGTITERTVLKVVGKISSPGPISYCDKNSNGLLVPMAVVSGDVQLDSQYGRNLQSTIWGKVENKDARIICVHLPYKAIEPVVEVGDVPETIVYTLRDNATGEFFAGWEFGIDSYGMNRSTEKPKMSRTFSGAKKYKTSSAVKASIRDFTGYNDGIDGYSTPEYLSCGSKKIDLPPTWEMVAIDKTTNSEKEVIDVQDWFRDVMRLRVLTADHGSAVRSVYKKAEGQGMEAIVLIDNRSRGLDHQGKPYDDAVSWEEDEGAATKKIAAIKEAAGQALADKYFRHKSEIAVAYACSRQDAFMLRMAISHPELDVRVYDFSTMEEIVDYNKASA